MIYQFEIEMKCTGLGVVEANNLDEAKELIKKEEWDDIIDTYNLTYVKLLEIKEDIY